MTKPTTHNPSNFDPADYLVVGYFDNQPPMFCHGQTIEEANAVYNAWRARAIELFGENCYAKMHRCVHCGTSNVRYVAAVEHKPTGDIVCFGGTCATTRVPLDGRDEFKLKHIRTNAMNQRRHAEKMAKISAYLSANPEFKAVVDARDDGVHQRNSFLHDVIGKLNHYGEISDKQRDSVIKSAARDHEFAANRAEREASRKEEDSKPRGEAPEGRATVEGKVLAVKWVENGFGGATKMMVELDNRAKVWCSAPTIYGDDGQYVSVERGDRVSFRATMTRADDDKSMAFGKRPSNGKIIPATEMVDCDKQHAKTTNA